MIGHRSVEFRDSWRVGGIATTTVHVSEDIKSTFFGMGETKFSGRFNQSVDKRANGNSSLFI